MTESENMSVSIRVSECDSKYMSECVSMSMSVCK